VRLEDAALRIDKRYAVAPEHKAWLQHGSGQVIVDFPQPSHMLESRHAHLSVDVSFNHRRRHSLPETVLIVPGQGIGIGPQPDIRRHVDCVAMKRVIVPAVFELLSDAPADLEAQIGYDRDVACIEQAMNVPPQKQSVPCLVLATIAIGPDMGSLQRRQRPFLRYRAAPSIDVRDEHPECILPEARTNELRRAKSCLPGFHVLLLLLTETMVHGLP